MLSRQCQSELLRLLHDMCTSSPVNFYETDHLCTDQLRPYI
jgi:hypothetical protein